MIVKELITALKKLDPEKAIVVEELGSDALSMDIVEVSYIVGGDGIDEEDYACIKIE